MQLVVMAPKTLSTKHKAKLNQKPHQRENQTRDPRETIWKVQREGKTSGAAPERTSYEGVIGGGSRSAFSLGGARPRG